MIFGTLEEFKLAHDMIADKELICEDNSWNWHKATELRFGQDSIGRWTITPYCGNIDHVAAEELDWPRSWPNPSRS